MRLLLLSNSSTPGDPYLSHARAWLGDFLGPGARRVAFVPYAAVTVSFDAFTDRVREALAPAGLDVSGVHDSPDPNRALAQADAVLVGGGNTFHLLRLLYRTGLMESVRKRVHGGLPYVGWSAGANVAAPSIRTTNDMPIVEPASMAAYAFVPFQINPHYTDAVPPGHMGETRADRLAEFVTVCPEHPVLGLPEGTALRVEGTRAERLGDAAPRLFSAEHPQGRLVQERDLSFLMG